MSVLNGLKAASRAEMAFLCAGMAAFTCSTVASAWASNCRSAGKLSAGFEGLYAVPKPAM